MACSLCFFKNPQPYYIAVLVPFLLCTALLGCGFLISPLIFTLSFLILTSIFFTFSNHKETPGECSSEVETITLQEGQIQGYKIAQLDSFSESESIDHSSVTDQEDSEADWPDSGRVGPSPDLSDDCISDEESLIEIALPSGHFVGPKKDEPVLNSQQKFHSLMEFLADGNEVNEEDNLIEIDISVGSIKCSKVWN